ncbi:MAG: YncE family protein [Bacteroidales bacterium]
MGLAISPDNKTVYVAGGQENKIYMFDINSGKKTDSINCSYADKKSDYTHGYIGDMVLSADGKRLYAVDQIGFRMIAIDVQSKSIRYNVPVGRYPFGITLSPDEKTVYVANVGMYQYNLVKRRKNGAWKNGTIDFPAAAYGSKQSEEGIHSDSLDIPGLGPINTDESFSVWE